MNLNNIQFYSNKTPELNELVTCIPIKKYDDEGKINFILPDYNNINAMMTFNKATRKKRNVKWKKILKLNKKTVAIVENITTSRSNQNQIDLSFIDLDKNSEEYHKYLEIEKSNYYLKEIIKNLAFKKKYNFKDLWEKIVLPLDRERNEINTNNQSHISLFQYVKSNIKNLSVLDKDDMVYLESMFDKKNNIPTNNKIKTKFNIASLNGYDIIKNIFDSALENYDQELVTIKRNKGTEYYIESCTNKINKKNHQEISEKIKNLSIENKIKFKLV